MENKKVDVWHDDEMKWVDYSLEELDEYFHFVKKPDWEDVREIYLFNGGFETWIKVVSNNDCETSYNKVHGTYVEVGV